MNLFKLAAASAVVLATAACATAPENIRPAYISPAQYAGQDCTQLVAETSRVLTKAEELSVKQRKERQKDQAALGIGLVVFAPAALFMIGSDQSGELATLKGQYQALQEVAQQKQCAGMPSAAMSAAAVASPAMATPPEKRKR